MKNYLFIALFFFAYAVSFSQTFNVAKHEGRNQTFNMVGINNKSFYLEKNTPMQYCCLDSVQLVGRDNNGNQIMNLPVARGAHMNYGRVTVTEKKTLLVYAGTEWGGCDYNDTKFQVKEIDTLGNVLWSSVISNQKVEALLPLPSGNRIMLTSNAMLKLNANGQTLATYTTSFVSPLNSACILNNGNILVSYGNTLAETDTLGNAINTTTLAPFSELSQVPAGEIYGISSGNIVRLSSAYSVLASSSISNFSASAYYFRNDSVFVAGNEANLVPKYVLLDTAFNILHQSSSNLEQVQCTGITVSDKTVKILSYGSSDSNMTHSHTFSGYFHTNFLGNITGTKDIGVVDLKLLDYTVTVNRYISPFNVWECYAKLRMKVVVKNLGNETVKNFKLSYYELITGISYCLIGLNEYHNAELRPGDTVGIFTGTMNIRPFAVSDTSKKFNFNMCMYTSVPDSTNDYEVSNNTTCSPISLEIKLTDIKKYSPYETELNIFPNPSNGIVNINASEAIIKLEIFDYSGKRVGIYMPNTSKFELKENSLAAGLYVFKITTANYTAVRKVIIQ
ncbi:MAG: T9SS type A sorting domain-containing protein [Bacteroidetes bacterium]|nr:T9SS type A sorting domain-containing protein [Bacteroidota bacterium]